MKGKNENCEFLARESVSSSPIVRIFGKGKCKFIANFSATMVTSLPSLSLCLYLSLSLSPKVPHAQYRKRFRASYNTRSCGAEIKHLLARDTLPGLSWYRLHFRAIPASKNRTCPFFSTSVMNVILLTVIVNFVFATLEDFVRSW